MKTLKYSIVTVFFIVLAIINLNVDYQLSPFNFEIDIELTEANADPVVDDYRKETETCWYTGEEFEICRFNPGMICDPSAQGTCSDTDPGESP